MPRDSWTGVGWTVLNDGQRSKSFQETAGQKVSHCDQWAWCPLHFPSSFWKCFKVRLPHHHASSVKLHFFYHFFIFVRQLVNFDSRSAAGVINWTGSSRLTKDGDRQTAISDLMTWDLGILLPNIFGGEILAQMLEVHDMGTRFWVSTRHKISEYLNTVEHDKLQRIAQLCGRIL